MTTPKAIAEACKLDVIDVHPWGSSWRVYVECIPVTEATLEKRLQKQGAICLGQGWHWEYGYYVQFRCEDE